MSEQTKDSGIDRRTLLGTVGAVAASGMALEAALGEGPAAKVEDRSSSIRITNLRAIPVGPKAYVKIETNHQITGWGEITGLEPQRRLRPGRVAAASCSTARTRRASSTSGRSCTARTATCAAGRSWSTRFRPSTWRCGTSPASCMACRSTACWAARAASASACIPRPRRHKVGTGGPHPFSGNMHDIAPLVKMIQDTRKRVGPDGAVMFDAHCSMPPPLLIQFAAAIEPYDVMWIEEPAVPGNIEVFKQLQQIIKVPLATGERDRTIWEVDRPTCRIRPSTFCNPTSATAAASASSRRSPRWPKPTTCRWPRTTPAPNWA